MSDFEKLKEDFKNKLARAQNSKEVDLIRAEIFSKNGFINSEFKRLGSLTEEDKKKNSYKNKFYKTRTNKII